MDDQGEKLWQQAAREVRELFRRHRRASIVVTVVAAVVGALVDEVARGLLGSRDDDPLRTVAESMMMRFDKLDSLVGGLGTPRVDTVRIVVDTVRIEGHLDPVGHHREGM